MLKFNGNRICYGESEKELACLEVRDHVSQDEKYVVYLKGVVDYLDSNQLRDLITSAYNLQPANIVQAGMKKSLVEQLKQKLHDCLMQTNLEYRYEFETSQYKEKVRILENLLKEEQQKRYQLENELFELKHSLSVQDSSQSEEESE